MDDDPLQQLLDEYEEEDEEEEEKRKNKQRNQEKQARTAGIEYCKNWAEGQGYKIAVTRSQWTNKKKRESVRGRVYLGCSLSGFHRRKDFNSRKTYHSRKVGCPFNLMVVLRHGAWNVEYNDGDCFHNHN